MHALLKKHRHALLVLLASTLLLAWSSIPNWVGFAVQDEHLSYMGAFFDTPDYAAHVAMIRAGMQGDWAYSFRFTTEPQPPQYTRLFYVLLGQLNRLLRMEPEGVFQAARWFWGYAAFFALFGLIQRVLRSRRVQWLAFLLAALGSGLGYFQLAAGLPSGQGMPLDLWLIDAYMLFSLSLFPHFGFTLAMMCIGLSAFFRFLDSRRPADIGLVIVPAALVQMVNPLGFVLVDVVIVAACLAQWWNQRKIDKGQLLALMGIAAAQIPLILYNYLILVNDPFGRAYTLQHATPSPAPVFYLLGFGLFWPPAAIGSIRAVRHRDPGLLGMLAWVAAAFILAYAPTLIQRRFLLGITIPLGILAAHGLEALFGRLESGQVLGRRLVPLVSILVVVIIGATSLISVPAFSAYIVARAPELFYPQSLDEAFQWINENTGQDDVILSTDLTARLTAQETGRRVYFGHPMETLYYEDKQQIIRSLYRNELSASQLEELPDGWIVYGPYEQQLASEFTPPDGFELVWENQDVRIFRME